MKTTHKTKSKTYNAVSLLDNSAFPDLLDQMLIREPNGKTVPLSTHILTGSYVPSHIENMQAFSVKMVAMIVAVYEDLNCEKSDMPKNDDWIENLYEELKAARGVSRLIVMFKWLCHDIFCMMKRPALNMRISRAKKKLVNHPNMRQLIASVAKELKRQQS